VAKSGDAVLMGDLLVAGFWGRPKAVSGGALLAGVGASWVWQRVGMLCSSGLGALGPRFAG
jgi:hypothetical protein